MIDLKEALTILEDGEYHSLRYITADKVKGTGGQVIELAKARILRPRRSTGNINRASEKVAKTDTTRNPNHSLHFTRNLELPNKQIRKVHPLLITHINNQEVV